MPDRLDMEHERGRLERDVEDLRKEVRETRTVAERAAIEIAAHKDGCVEASERVQQTIDDVRRMVSAVHARVGELRDSLHKERDQDAEVRRERQTLIDKTTTEWRVSVHERLSASEQWNRRVGIAVVVAAIAIVGTVVGTGVRPFVLPAIEAARSLK